MLFKRSKKTLKPEEDVSPLVEEFEEDLPSVRPHAFLAAGTKSSPGSLFYLDMSR